VKTQIPILNLYHLLCYAWDRLDERDLIDAGATQPPRDTLNLLGLVLANGSRALIRRGFERGYRERQEEIVGIRGNIAFAPTLRKQLPRYGRTECVFDELEHDTPANRIICSTVSLLIRSPLVDAELRHDLVSLRRHFRDVTEIRATVADCRRVVLHRNNRHYGFIIDVCCLIIDGLLADENGLGVQFRDFTREHQAMARLFEEFVRNFYRHHAAECGVSDVTNQQIAWAGDPGGEESARLWPGMYTDICLVRPGAPLVIDCKFYTEALKSGRGGRGEGLNSANLYQLFTYTQNMAAKPGFSGVEGLLIYAENGDAFEISHSACGRRLSAATLNLNLEWPAIHARLVSLVKVPAKREASRVPASTFAFN
jgi:5-methylcytosine-specific restriction enzyme subunit McrC